MSLPVIVIGSGGHAAVIADALLASGANVIGFTDSDPRRFGTLLCGLPVLGDDSVLAHHFHGKALLANGIGGTRVATQRRAVQERLEARGWEFVCVRHPAAVVSRFASIGAGAQLLAASVVQAGATVGKGCIINTAAVVEHDVVLGEFVHVAPRALLCGTVSVGANSHVGAGAVVRQHVRIGAATLVGAGAVVVGDFAGAGILVGVPARETLTRV